MRDMAGFRVARGGSGLRVRPASGSMSLIAQSQPPIHSLAVPQLFGGRFGRSGRQTTLLSNLDPCDFVIDLMQLSTGFP